MHGFRRASRKLAASMKAAAAAEAYQETIAALTLVLEQFLVRLADLEIRMGSISAALTSMVAEELAERIDPIAADQSALRREFEALRTDVDALITRLKDIHS